MRGRLGEGGKGLIKMNNLLKNQKIVIIWNVSANMIIWKLKNSVLCFLNSTCDEYIFIVEVLIVMRYTITCVKWMRIDK